MRRLKKLVSPALIIAIVFFIALFIYFAVLNRYHLFYQEQIQLFRFDRDYFAGFLSKPGGISEYLGLFFIQFYLKPLAGPFIVTLAGIAVFILAGLIFRKFRISGIIWSCIPVLLLVSLQSDQAYYLGYTIGFLISLAFIAFYISVKTDYLRYVAGFVGCVVLYPLAGGFSFIAIAVCIIFEILYRKSNYSLIVSLGYVSLTALILYLSWHYVYLLPVGSGWMNPIFFVSNPTTKYWLFLLLAYFPFLLIVTGIWFILSKKPQLQFGWNWKTFSAGLIVFSAFSIGIMKYAYDYKTELLLGIDKHVQSAEWDKALKLSAKSPGLNRIAVYLTNLALFKSGKMGDRLFYYNQFGSSGLWLDWGNDASPFFGCEVFYQLGYINEAYRWAFEALVSKGQSPRILKRLTLTSLINRDYAVGEKYLNILEQTLFYRNWARYYRGCIKDTALLPGDQEIAAKRHLLIQSDFFANVTDYNFELNKLLENHPDNRMAFEYYMASLLLDKKLDFFAANISRIKDFGFKEIPVHYEEALLAYMVNTETSIIPAGYSIRESTRQRFNDYFKTYSFSAGDPDQAVTLLKKRFGNTYWFYLQFK